MPSPVDVVEVERETALYYDLEEGREDRPVDSRRIAARQRFIDAMPTQGGQRPILEIGTGPGRDAVVLIEAGLDVVGVDLSLGHARRAGARGVPMTVGSARTLPFATGSIGAVWSMSTLMHVPAVAIDATMLEVARVLTPGATAAIGVWGGANAEHYSDLDRSAGGRRLFSRHSEARWRSLLEIVGTISDFEVWTGPPTDDAFSYFLAFVTAHRRAGPG